MHHIPAIATTVNIIRLMTADCPPNIQPTMSNLKRPIEPQFNAPITVKINAILSSIFITSAIYVCIIDANMPNILLNGEKS